MFGMADYGAFVVAIIVFLLIPGPGSLALIISTDKGGIQGGLAATLGVILGDQVLLWLAVAIAALTFAYGLTVLLLTHFLAGCRRTNPRIPRTPGKLAGLFLIGFGITSWRFRAKLMPGNCFT